MLLYYRHCYTNFDVANDDVVGDIGGAAALTSLFQL